MNDRYIIKKHFVTAIRTYNTVFIFECITLLYMSNHAWNACVIDEVCSEEIRKEEKRKMITDWNVISDF